MDVMMIFKGNDEHSYLYVFRNEGPWRCILKGLEAYEGQTHNYDGGLLCGTGGRGGDVTAEEGRKGDAKQGAVKRQSNQKVLYNGMDQLLNVIKMTDFCGVVLQITG